MIRRKGLLGRKPDEPIEFVDAEVKRICVEQWGGTDGGVAAASDRIGNKKVRGKTGEITYRQAASVRVIQNQFQNNATIEYFDELQYFINLERLNYSGSAASNCGSFMNCTNLKHITLPDSLKYLSPGYNYSKGTFYNCTSLTDIYLPDSIVGSCEALFNGCTSLKTVRWSSNLRHFPTGNYNFKMFLNCTSLESITNLSIPQTIGNTTLAETCSQEFENCRNLNLDFIDFNNLVFIASYSFKGCKLPENLILPKLTRFGPYGFRDTSIKRLYLPILSSMPDGEYTFDYCPAYLIDFGSNLSGTFRSYNYDMKTLVLRGDDYSNLSFKGNKIGRIYVNSSIINTFKTQFSSLENIIFSIGGLEWTNQFGSSDEWADYPKNRELYDSQVEYLQGDKTAYIDTGINFTEKTVTELTLAYTAVTGRNDIVWGAYWDASPHIPGVQVGMSNVGKWLVAGGNGISVSGATNNTALTLNQKYTIRITYSAQQPNYNAFLFARNNDQSSYIPSEARIYNAKIWSSDAIVRDYIPVRKNGVGYLFDKITGTLFGNANSEGAFIIGPDV